MRRRELVGVDGTPLASRTLCSTWQRGLPGVLVQDLYSEVNHETQHASVVPRGAGSHVGLLEAAVDGAGNLAERHDDHHVAAAERYRHASRLELGHDDAPGFQLVHDDSSGFGRDPAPASLIGRQSAATAITRGS